VPRGGRAGPVPLDSPTRDETRVQAVELA